MTNEQATTGKTAELIEVPSEQILAPLELSNYSQFLDKRAFFNAAQQEYGDSENWNAEQWQQIIDDLKEIAPWIDQDLGGVSCVR